MSKDKFYREALREWRGKHTTEMFAVLDFIYLPERDQAEIIERAHRARTITGAGLSTLRGEPKFLQLSNEPAVINPGTARWRRRA